MTGAPDSDTGSGQSPIGECGRQTLSTAAASARAVTVSVVVRSRNEAPRLRLTLASLIAQTVPCEIVVVNDASTDETAEVLAALAGTPGLVVRHNDRPAGRSGAANQGATQANGDILLFLDGDTLAAPDLVARHVVLHAERPGSVARGETWHLRSTRPFRDPDSGEPFADQAERVAAMSPRDLERARVTVERVTSDFAGIMRRAQPGIYPGTAPRLLYELEMRALIDDPDCPALWAAASGSNQSVPRAAFLASGGFEPEISINEHRELALRLTQQGLRMAPVPEARTCHLIHRSGWRDPLDQTEWEARFHARHPLAEVALLRVLWSSLDESRPLPGAAAITSLRALHEAARRCDDLLAKAARDGITLAPDDIRAHHFAQAGTP